MPKAMPKAAPGPGAPRVSWPVVINSVGQADRLLRNGTTYFHARRIISAMGLQTWSSHLTEKIPMCRDEFGWVFGTDYLQESAGHRGIPPFWLTQAAALSVDHKYA